VTLLLKMLGRLVSGLAVLVRTTGVFIIKSGVLVRPPGAFIMKSVARPTKKSFDKLDFVLKMLSIYRKLTFFVSLRPLSLSIASETLEVLISCSCSNYVS